MNRKLLSYFLSLGLIMFFAGFAHGYPFKAALNSVQVVPANFSTGRGSCKINADSGIPFSMNFDVNCEFSGLSGLLTSVDVRYAPPGENGNTYCFLEDVRVTYPLPYNGTGSVHFSCWRDMIELPISEAKNIYVVLQTSAFPEGEVRGQLKTLWLDGDVDGEGRMEVSVFRPGDGYSYTYCSMNGTTINKNLDWDPKTDTEPFLADFDGDGIADWSFVRTITHNGIPGMMFTAYRQSRDNQMVYINWGRSTFGDIPAYGDYNGDGKIDLAVFRSTTGEFHISGIASQRWGMEGDKPCPGDYDGDGKTDLCVVRPENGQLVWYIRLGEQYRRIAWGLPTDEIYPTYPVNFDDDYANDLLVSRVENGQRFFYVLKSSYGEFSSWFVLPWGLATDKAKIGDYDGDGRTDFASIREVNNQLVWYINQGANGTHIVYWGLSGDK